MGYPYGDRLYPTFERFERDPERLENTFWTMLTALTRARRRELADRPVTVKLTVDNKTVDARELVRDAVGAAFDERYYDGDWLPDGERIDLMGLAFTRTLAAHGLDDADEMSRLFQDLFAILHDHVVSTADQPGEAAE